jgi:hypothetical protein
MHPVQFPPPNPLLLNNILVSPLLVKNLIFVRVLTRDNNVSIEFDPFGFSVKDLPTCSVILQCDSHGELYPLVPAAPEVHTATVPSIDLWHLRLGHPGRCALHQSLPQLEFTTTKQSPSLCEACQLSKHV